MSLSRLLVTAFTSIALLLACLPADAQSPASCAEANGIVTQQTYTSTVLRQDMVYAIYTPPCYMADTTRLYPVVYLMHGSDATGTDYWLNLGLVTALDAGITAGYLPPMIVVLPYGDWIANQNQFGAVSWANVFLRDLMPNVETIFRVDARREMRAVGGISRGGFWAFNLAFLHPELFSALGGHSAFFHPDHLRTNNPMFLADTAPGLDTLRIWLDYGQYDYAMPNGDVVHRSLEARGVPHVYMVYPNGRHSRDYWAAHLGDYLLFYGLPWLTPTSTPTITPTPAGSPEPTGTPQTRDLPAHRNQARTRPFFLPVVAYRSLRMSIPAENVRTALTGTLDSDLVLDQATADALTAQGAALHAETRIVAPEDLLPLLERERRRWTVRVWETLSPRWRVLLVDEVHPADYLLQGNTARYPLALASGSADGIDFEATALTRITISGVTAFVRDTASAIDANGTAWAASGLRDYTRRADFFHISNEVSFYETCPRFGGPGVPRGAFCAKDAYLDVLRDLGTDLIELSGNHNLDFGPEAYLRTLDMYTASGMKPYGGGKDLAAAREPVRVDHHGNRVALLACNWVGPHFALATADSPGAAFCDEGWLAEAIPALKAEDRIVIVTVQYREFDQFVPTPSQRADFRALADLGADVVIGTQAHVPQTFEFYRTTDDREVYIHYGLGNLYFDQTYFQMRFFMPTLYIYRGKVQSAELFVGIIDDFGRPRPMDAHNRAHFLGHMFSR